MAGCRSPPKSCASFWRCDALGVLIRQCRRSSAAVPVCSKPMLSSVSTKQMFSNSLILAQSSACRCTRCSGWRCNRAGWRLRCSGSRARTCTRSCAGRQVFDQLGDEGARAGGGVEDFHALVAQRLAEVLEDQMVGALDHEAHDLIRRVDHAQAVGGLGVVGVVEILVERLEELLLLVVVGDLRRRGR